MDRRQALLTGGLGSLGLISTAFGGRKLDDAFSTGVILMISQPYGPRKVIEYVDKEDIIFFDRYYYYHWITVEQMMHGLIADRRQIISVMRGKYTANELIDYLNMQLAQQVEVARIRSNIYSQDDLIMPEIEFFRNQNGEIRAKVIKPAINNTLDKIVDTPTGRLC